MRNDLLVVYLLQFTTSTGIAFTPRCLESSASEAIILGQSCGRVPRERRSIHHVCPPSFFIQSWLDIKKSNKMYRMVSRSADPKGISHIANIKLGRGVRFG